MATLYITEFAMEAKDGADAVVPCMMLPPIAQQTRTVSGTSAQSSALNAQTVVVRLSTDTACFIETGSSNPTATTSSMPLFAGQSEYFGVPLNCGWKIAARTA